MKEIYLTKLLTNQNVTLWNKIEDIDSVNIILWNKNYSELFSNDIISEIRLSSLDLNAFNHELCHLYLNQIFGGLYITLSIRMPYDLRAFINKGCLEHMCNCMEHRLFYDLYKQIGGNPEGFLPDFHLRKGNNYHTKINKLTLQSLDSYLGNIFSILGDCNENIVYNSELKKYNKISPTIYAACVKLFDEIIKIGITKQVEDFEFSESGVIINKTHSNSCEVFWTVVSEELLEL